ncbi:uncharacterized protein SAPINGB_P004459 [Magnusiomyces paraingens]|uniref:Kinesin motor domain-containing protein n=1 Tax=Magnusiomyces paraingens TaxID=2606893 RepID=A0A5E8BWU1_9ASCO|nr:uncharacterized protein SAPINGB_P004459 [Saprochaete ingens]VVT55164.1 unnamed protein product [Saprochaete ingens]
MIPSRLPKPGRAAGVRPSNSTNNNNNNNSHKHARPGSGPVLGHRRKPIRSSGTTSAPSGHMSQRGLNARSSTPEHSEMAQNQHPNKDTNDTSLGPHDMSIISNDHDTSSERRSLDSKGSDAGSNISVVVRCRGRNDREIQEKSHVVVKTSALDPTSVVVGLSDDGTGVPAGQNSKIYKVDQVFGPEADQTIVYNEVVAPMVTEVLRGATCTVFAYGQTGTGKTYTMTGDETLSPTGGISHEAGVLPRFCRDLFKAAEADGYDFAVKSSFIELYNEDLRDLLSDSDSKKVTILDPSTSNNMPKTSGITRGQENLFIQSADHGLKVLQRGLRKRQVASTRINELSSRSHTIFTITVYMSMNKRTSQDVAHAELSEPQLSSIVKESCIVGKINFVDLAGSENIGKSGADNKRAREAGMINQSLLALGRVINALVDKTSHIPYRESKLTRLLQDSLGGQTKTCIIATVSPAHINLEETLSTLEYATKAKNIRNKPQFRYLVSKTTLFKEWSDDYIRLQRDLEATRKKHGIYLTEEHYKELVSENAELKLRLEEQERKVTLQETQLKTLRGDVESTKSQLNETRRQLSTATKNFSDSVTNLSAKEEELAKAKSNWTLERLLKEAHAATERKLQQTAIELAAKLEKSTEIVATLQIRLAQSADRDNENRTRLNSHNKAISSTYTEVSEALSAFDKTHNKESKAFKQAMKQLVDKQLTQLQELLREVSDTNNAEKSFMREFAEAGEQYGEQTDTARKAFGDAQESVKSRVEAGLSEIQNSLNGLVREAGSKIEEHQQITTRYSASLRERLTLLFDDVNEAMNKQSAEIRGLNERLVSSTQDSIKEYEDAVAQGLFGMLEKEMAQSKHERLELFEKYQALVQAQEQEQAKRMETRVEEIHSTLGKHQHALSAASTAHAASIHQVLQVQQTFQQTLETRQRDITRGIEGGVHDAETSAKALQHAVAQQAESVRGQVEQHVQEVDAGLGNVATRAREVDELQRGHVLRLEQQVRRAQEAGVAAAERVERGLEEVTAEAARVSIPGDGYVARVGEALGRARRATQNVANQSQELIGCMSYEEPEAEANGNEGPIVDAWKPVLPSKLPATMPDGTSGTRPISELQANIIGSFASLLAELASPQKTSPQKTSPKKGSPIKVLASSPAKDQEKDDEKVDENMEEEADVEECSPSKVVRSPLCEISSHNLSSSIVVATGETEPATVKASPMVMGSPEKNMNKTNKNEGSKPTTTTTLRVNFFPANKRLSKAVEQSGIPRKRPASEVLENGLTRRAKS